MHHQKPEGTSVSRCSMEYFMGRSDSLNGRNTLNDVEGHDMSLTETVSLMMSPAPDGFQQFDRLGE